MLAAGRDADGHGQPDGVVASLLAKDALTGVRDPNAFSELQRTMLAHAKALHDWLVAERSAGHVVLGYGAASRAVALLRQARVDRALLPTVVDISPAKQGLRMPGTDIPVSGPSQLADRRPPAVLLLVPDLLAEVRSAFPEVEAAGGRGWMPKRSAHDACSRTRNWARHRPRVGPMLPTGRPSSPDMSA